MGRRSRRAPRRRVVPRDRSALGRAGRVRHWVAWCALTFPSIAGEDDVPQDGIDLGAPAKSAEDAVMADAGLQMVALPVRAQAAAQLVRGERLAQPADVVFLSLDRQQRGPRDRARFDGPAAPPEFSARQRVLLEYRADGLQV